MHRISNKGGEGLRNGSFSFCNRSISRRCADSREPNGLAKWRLVSAMKICASAGKEKARYFAKKSFSLNFFKVKSALMQGSVCTTV